MKNKIIVLTLFVLLSSNLTSTFAWGKKAHTLVNIKAIEMLPYEMDWMKNWKEQIGDSASNADIRRDNGSNPAERPKHFIDIDYYKEFIEGNMISDMNQLLSLYGEETVTKMGTLPWAAFETYNKLIDAFIKKDKDKIIIFSADLGHYVADGHQPFHTSLNYDGQLTGQKGIHGRYESEMVNRYIDQIVNAVSIREVKYISKPLDYILNFLSGSNFYAPVIFTADKTAFTQAGSHGSPEYYRLLWFRTKQVTIDQLSNAAGVLASLIYSAWADAGKPIFTELK